MFEVLLVEDDVRLARSVAAALKMQSADRFTVRRGHTFAEGLELARHYCFAVALIDLGLPDAPGVELIRALTASKPSVRCLAFTVLADRDSVLEAVSAGAVGYLLKDDSPERLATQLVDCVQGNAPVSSGIAGYLLDACRSGSPSAGLLATLTARETEVLSLIARGTSYQQCADQLGIGLGTVQTHVKAVYRKLDIGNKAEAAAWAVHARLVP